MKKKIIKVEKGSIDNRGYLRKIFNSPFNCINYIKSFKGSIRGCHYHKKNSHYIYVIKGQLMYFYKEKNKKKIKKITVKKNFLIFTPNFEAHMIIFKKESEILEISKYKFSKISYNKDTVKVNFFKNNLQL
jgi:dTDP-4-dehydrorhamnose 3,5-epimerase-like enzyme